MTPSAALLQWYDRHGRKLPWRKTRDPYKILVSEIMLQQTQVPRVLLFYKRWLKQFPNWKALASASNAEVIRAWAGLGYNRRALMLRDIAREIAYRGVPKSETEWRALKGIGPYTAAALACFSFHERVMPVDTNIRRVLSRFVLGQPYSAHNWSDRHSCVPFVPKNQPRFFDIPQALFDLATLVCKKIPDCASCPLQRECKAAPKFLSGRCSTPARVTKASHERRHRNKKFPDRIYRGRILKVVRESPRGVFAHNLGPLVDPSFDQKLDATWLAAMIDRLARDGLIAKHRDRLTLNSSSNRNTSH